MRQRFRIFLFRAEAQLTLCDSALEHCAGPFKERENKATKIAAKR
jgi:hypothetical protein